jgi:glycosyl transferase family 28
VRVGKTLRYGLATRRACRRHAGATGVTEAACMDALLPEVLLLIVDAGGGHRAAANALVAAAERVHPPFRLRVESLQRIFEPLDPLRRITGLDLEQIYNAMVRRRLTGHLVPLLRGLQWSIGRLHKVLTRQVATYLRIQPPAAVVSLAPNFNAVVRDAVRAARPGLPFHVLLTDLADFPPHFWMEPEVDGVIVATDEAVEQARRLGLTHVDRTSGMVLHPRFHDAGEVGLRDRVRCELGVPRESRLVLLLFGGKGAPEMLPLARRLLELDPHWHVVAVCGDNPRLFARMERLALKSRGRLHRFGFTDRVSDLMSAADLLLTKPGPGSLAEAFHRQVPVVVALDRRTIPQERYNARFVSERGVGVVVGSWREMPAAARELCGDGERLEGFRRALARLPENRAVWEVLEVLARVVNGTARTAPPLARTAPIAIRRADGSAARA